MITPARLTLSAVLFAMATTSVLASGSSITIDQTSNVNTPATWTLLPPTQDKIERNDWSYSVTEQPVGKYTLFVTPPKGTNAAITLSDSGTVLQQVNHQLSFEANEGQMLHIQITNTLVNSGKVGVNSQPSGIPFEIRGPNNWSTKGVTPASYENVAVGNYSVQYLPDGCLKPSAKSDLLLKNGRADFFIELDCKTFVPVEKEKETHMTTVIGGQTISFTDVPIDAWFTPFVLTAANRGILGGYKDELGNTTGTFGPGNPLTLAELSKIAHELASVNELEFSQAPDNPGALWQWFKDYIVSSEQRGWVVYQDSTIDLNRPATRGEVVITLLQALDVPMHWAKGTAFKDVTARTKYAHAVETAADEGFVGGSTDADGNLTGFFHPDNPVTRAEMARILINVYEKKLRRAAPEF
jgi:hypothetical protein